MGVALNLANSSQVMGDQVLDLYKIRDAMGDADGHIHRVQELTRQLISAVQEFSEGKKSVRSDINIIIDKLNQEMIAYGSPTKPSDGDLYNNNMKLRELTTDLCGNANRLRDRAWKAEGERDRLATSLVALLGAVDSQEDLNLGLGTSKSVEDARELIEELGYNYRRCNQE